MKKNFSVSIQEEQKYVERLKIIPEVCEKKVLIVDDSKPFVEFLSALLGDEGAIYTANNGSEGLSKLRITYYDAIISDVDMPFLDGISFYKEAHKNEPNIHERFIFVTGSANENYLAFFRENNLRYLRKPLALEVLKKYVHEILSSKKPHE